MTELAWLITMGPSTTMFSNSSILSLDPSPPPAWPPSWQLEAPSEPALSLGTKSSLYPSIPIQASWVTFALETSVFTLDRAYFHWSPLGWLWAQGLFLGTDSQSIIEGPSPPSRIQETVQDSKDFVSVFLQAYEWWASPLMSLFMEAFQRLWGQEAEG